MILLNSNAAEPPDEEDEDDETEEKMEPVSARPRRLSEVSVKKNNKPIPKSSAFFIFSHTNK